MLIISSTCPAFQQPDLARIVERSNESQVKLETLGAGWATTIELNSGVQIIVETSWSSKYRRYEFKMLIQGQPTTLATIIERENLWYVESPDGRFKTRPYEALLLPASLYLFLSKSDLKFVTDGVHERDLGNYVGNEGGRAIYEQELPETVKTSLRRSLARLNELLEQGADQHETIVAQGQKLNEMLSSKVQVRLDLKHGFIAQDGIPGKRVWISDFKWLDNDSSRLFDVDDREWIDRSQWKVVDEGTIEFGFDPNFAPGKKSDNITQVLLDSKTGEIRRVPYQFGISSKGCFSQDRSKMYVPGFLPDLGTFGLFEIDLRTRAHRQLGGTELTSGFLFSPQLSPDGRQLVVQRLITGTLDSQIMVVDIESGTSQAIGKPLDTAFVSWHPNGNSLILIRRTTVDVNSPQKATVCQMDMSGKLIEIVDGNQPVVLSGISKIMFENQDDGAWYLCDLDGKHPMIVGDGLKEFGFPASSPDGTKVVMVNFKHPDGPKPVIVSVASGNVKELNVQKGLWTMPSWK